MLGGQPPQPVRLRVRGAAVVQHDRHPGQQAAGQVVPHHPAGRGVPGEHVARVQVLVERERLEVLQDDAAVAVHDRLRQAGGAGGVDHPERVRERHLLELGLVLDAYLTQVVPAQGAFGRRGVTNQVHLDDRGQAGQGRGDLRDHLGPGVFLAVVGVAVAGDEHRRLDLREPVDHAARAEVRRARRPDRAQAGRGEQADDRLGDVRQQGGDPVATAHSQPGQAARDARHLVRELAVGQAPGPGPFGIKDDRRTVGIRPRGPQRVTGVIQRGTAEPLDVRHDLAGQHRSVTAVTEHVEVIPDRRPEGGGIRHRPLP